MKHLVLALALVVGFITPARSATVPMGMAQVDIDPATGKLLSLPMAGSTGAYGGVTVKSSVLPTGAATEATLGQLSYTASLQLTADGNTNSLLGKLTQTVGTDQSSYTLLTNAAYVATTHTVTSVNGTATAASNVPLQYWVTAAMGGAAIRYSITPSLATAPTAAWLQNFGMYAAATTTTQVTGRWAPGTHLHFISVGATAVSVTASLVQ